MTYDLIIVGAGPAGLTAAIYASRKKLNFKILAQKIGGEQLPAAGWIENYPGIKSISSGAEFIKMLREHLRDYEVEVAEVSSHLSSDPVSQDSVIEEGQEVVKIEKKGDNFLVRTKRGSRYKTRAVIVASGKKPRELAVPGAKEFAGRGISYCAVCDAPLFKNKTVAVIGGGNAGLGSALDLTKYARKIYVLESGPKIIGDETTQEKLRQTGKTEFIVNTVIQKIKGDKFVSGLIYQDRKTKEIKELSVDGIFVHIGSVISSDFVKGFLKMNSAKEIVINHKNCQTSVKGIFAAGDVTDVPFKQIVIAAGQGAKATLAAYDYLNKLK